MSVKRPIISVIGSWQPVGLDVRMTSYVLI